MNLATREDLELWKDEVLQVVKELIKGEVPLPGKWVKSDKVMEVLECSPGTLQNLRQASKIEFSKIGGTLYYSLESIMQELEKNKQNAT